MVKNSLKKIHKKQSCHLAGGHFQCLQTLESTEMLKQCTDHFLLLGVNVFCMYVRQIWRQIGDYVTESERRIDERQSPKQHCTEFGQAIKSGPRSPDSQPCALTTRPCALKNSSGTMTAFNKAVTWPESLVKNGREL